MKYKNVEENKDKTDTGAPCHDFGTVENTAVESSSSLDKAKCKQKTLHRSHHMCNSRYRGSSHGLDDMLVD